MIKFSKHETVGLYFDINRGDEALLLVVPLNLIILTKR